MNYINVPIGGATGWGICGGRIALELCERIDARIIADETTNGFVQSHPMFQHLTPRLLPANESHPSLGDDCVMLQAIGDASMRPFSKEFEVDFCVGYTFFEATQLSQAAVTHARSRYDIIATGSHWCETILRDHGLDNVTTVIQGIDPRIFNPMYSKKRELLDRFVVFSGGKFELRKGQDLVIRAYKVLQDRHPDVMLITAWHNHWDWCWETMFASQHIQYDAEILDLPNEQRIARVLSANGIDLNRVHILPVLDNAQFPSIYQNTDIGLFPNRCEGGTNLVLMEYMACGKPVIASQNTGHLDIINSANALPIRSSGKMEIIDKGKTVSHWYEPDFDELVERLEWAYNNRDALNSFGIAAGMTMANRTWAHTASAFEQLMSQRSIVSRRAKNNWLGGQENAWRNNQL